ncbi:DegT/DnrJ/EryC1/StrS family aminotransferase [Dechloromonas sp. ARDL1]|uniref:DegT/DnrJ/EryC1/StrS family aminotransferase n=1 Tax=Dechloromonas sp. ARDL1 TaxID=3322121 RepID=UPI003DA76E59
MIRLIRPYITFDEVEADFRQMFADGMFTRGQHVEGFRKEIAAYCGVSYAHLATSATTALSVCLKLLGVGRGDEVVVSDFSFPATANVVEDLGARPVFADVSLETYNMLPATLEARITERTKAVIFVDAFGNPTGLHDILAICHAHGIPLIEDAACAIGSSERGVKVGGIADLTCFSFHPRKLLTTGEGGAITTRCDDWSAWFDIKLNHGARGMLGYGLNFVEQGYNYRLSEPQAIMGRVQLRKLDAIVAERNEIRKAYIEGLSGAGFVPQARGSDVVHNVQSLVFRVPSGVDRDALIGRLREQGVETTIGTYSLSGTTYYRRCYDNVQPNAVRLQHETLTVPCYTGVDVETVCTAILTNISG